MTWVKLDDSFADNPKIEAVGPMAAWLFVAGLCYCSTHLTDGKITRTRAEQLGNVPRTRREIARLVDANLWEDHGDFYMVHDYLIYQPSKAKVLAERDAAAERKRKSREKSQGESHRDIDPGHAVTHGGSHTPPDPTRPDPTPVVEVGKQQHVLEVVTGADHAAGRLTPKERTTLIADAADLVAERRADEQARGQGFRSSREAFVRGVAKAIVTDHADHAHKLLTEHPDMTADDLAERIEPAPERPRPPAEYMPSPMGTGVPMPDNVRKMLRDKGIGGVA
jgi:hypothetical protein